MVTEMGSLVTVVLVYFTFWFAISAWKSRNDVADIAWGPGFTVGTLYCIFQAQKVSWISYLILGLVAVWAIRLSIYIFLRNIGKGEDFRYRRWREEWGKSIYWRSYLQVFMLQGILLLVIGIPVWTSILEPSQASPIDSRSFVWIFFGVSLWTIGILFEAISDYQMANFKRHKSTSQPIMQSGLWRYSRHPNYFGESLLWWGIYLVCVANSAPGWSAIGPLVLTFLLLKVSGVPMLESKYRNNKHYQDYQRNTPSFIPWFPKNVFQRKK